MDFPILQRGVRTLPNRNSLNLDMNVGNIKFRKVRMVRISKMLVSFTIRDLLPIQASLFTWLISEDHLISRKDIFFSIPEFIEIAWWPYTSFDKRASMSRLMAKITKLSSLVFLESN